MPDYNKLALTAKNLLTKFGPTTAVTFHAQVEGAFDTSTDTRVLTSTNTVVKAVKLDYQAREIDGTNVKVGDVKLLVDAVSLTTAPEPGDTVTFDGKTWTVVGPAKDLKPGDISLLYELQLRGSK